MFLLIREQYQPSSPPPIIPSSPHPIIPSSPPPLLPSSPHPLLPSSTPPLIPSSPPPLIPSSPHPIIPSSHHPLLPSSHHPIIPSSGERLVYSSLSGAFGVAAPEIPFFLLFKELCCCHQGLRLITETLQRDGASSWFCRVCVCVGWGGGHQGLLKTSCPPRDRLAFFFFVGFVCFPSRVWTRRVGPANRNKKKHFHCAVEGERAAGRHATANPQIPHRLLERMVVTVVFILLLMVCWGFFGAFYIIMHLIDIPGAQRTNPDSLTPMALPGLRSSLAKINKYT